MKPRLLRPSKRQTSDVLAVIREAETHYEVTIKEAEASHATQAQALEKSHKENMLKLEHEALAEERCNHQAFMETCGTAFWVCPLEAHGVLIYPLQLLAGSPSLAFLIEMTAAMQPQAVADTGSVLHPLHQTHQYPSLASSSSILHPARACLTWGKKRRFPVTHLRSPLQKVETFG